jgi:hypothetical protein
MGMGTSKVQGRGRGTEELKGFFQITAFSVTLYIILLERRCLSTFVSFPSVQFRLEKLKNKALFLSLL